MWLRAGLSNIIVEPEGRVQEPLPPGPMFVSRYESQSFKQSWQKYTIGCRPRCRACSEEQNVASIPMPQYPSSYLSHLRRLFSEERFRPEWECRICDLRWS